MKDFNKSIWIGILIGIAIPIVGYAIVLIIFEKLAKAGLIQSSQGMFSIAQERTIWVLGIMFNMIPFQYFKFKKADRAMTGVVMMTILAVFIWLFYYHESIF
jgi:amino acid permease